MKVPAIPSVQAYNQNDPRQTNESVKTDDCTKENPSNQTEQKVKEAVMQLNKAAEESQHFLKFNYHKDAEQYYVQVIDSKSDEVIREIPSKEILDYFSDMKKFLGLIFDQRI